MDIGTLCDQIGLQEKIRRNAEAFDVSGIRHFLAEFRDYEKMNQACLQLRSALGEDPDGSKILACMLQASADAYALYQERGYGHDIYIATMKCYPRFLEETLEMTGKVQFDRWWWTTRQAGCHLFRIGTLEYERKQMEHRTVIGIHIPSDADLSPGAVEASFRDAKAFFHRHFPELDGCEWRCHSWLMDPQLKNMLKEDSNILQFQRRFTLFDPGEAGTEYIRWVFKTEEPDSSLWPSETSLQRNIRQHILAGGVIWEAYGKLQ